MTPSYTHWCYTYLKIWTVTRENLSYGFLTRSDINQAVQPQTIARDLKFRVYEYMYYIRATKTKAIILSSWSAALFSYMQKSGVVESRLIYKRCVHHTHTHTPHTHTHTHTLCTDTLVCTFAFPYKTKSRFFHNTAKFWREQNQRDFVNLSYPRSYHVIYF